MSRSYYELLGVASSAPVEEIKRAFRREIAKYHPDKVQHLGREFQEIAAVKAAELTQAYKTLCDESLRTEYDAGRAAEGRAPGARGGDGETAAPAAGGERWPAFAGRQGAPKRGGLTVRARRRP